MHEFYDSFSEGDEPRSDEALSPATQQVLQELAAHLTPRCRLSILSGAGISAASGIPTFRGPNGLWKEHRGEDLATPEAFARDPELVWEWYGWRRGLVHAASPNPAHDAIGALARHVQRVVIITQNVDGLHQRSRQMATERDLVSHRGPDSVEVIELHGSLWRLRCTSCGREVEDHGPGPRPGTLPHCSCSGLQRPGVVWFGEPLPAEALAAAHEAAVGCDVLLVVGTSAVVQPAASFAAVAANAGARVAEFNTDTTALSDRVDFAIRGPAERTLPRLVGLLGSGEGE